MNKEKYFLVGIKLPKESMESVEDSMLELENLVETAGGEVVGRVVQTRRSIDPVSYIGKGKLQEIDMIFDREEDVKGVLVFNATLSPSQVRNIEEAIECRVITRTELILDIFAIHAQSRIAKCQIESAQLSYLLPRLVGLGDSLSRTGAGIGTRGPGETKLETDRRKIRNRLALLKKELSHLEKATGERRKQRSQVFKVSVAGYTNVGKSALSSYLTKSDILSQNKLFATVDTTTRRLALNGIEAVLTDTVGFIRDLPHELVESFKSTLSETINADLVLHVVDPCSPLFLEKKETAEQIMDDLNVDVPVILVFNKIDLLTKEQIVQARMDFPEAFFVSVKENMGLEDLTKFLYDQAILYYKTQGNPIPEWIQSKTPSL